MNRKQKIDKMMCYETFKLLLILLFSGYSQFSDRVGLPLHNILSPFLLVMHISVDLKFGHIHFYTLQSCPSWSSNRYAAFNSPLYTFLHPVLVTFPHHMNIPSQSTTSNDSCEGLDSNQLSHFFTCLSWKHHLYSIIEFLCCHNL